MVNEKLVIFDCDGVLVDSEPIVNRVFVDLLSEIGWNLTYEQAAQIFVGKSSASCVAIVEQKLGRPVPADFLDRCREREVDALNRELKPVLGIESVLENLPYPKCVASNSSLRHVHLVLRITELIHHFNDQLFSAAQVARPKPFPDVYLYAAQQMGTSPDRCVVIEDSVPGVQAGSAAGMKVFGYAQQSDRDALAAAGAHLIFDQMSDLLELL